MRLRFCVGCYLDGGRQTELSGADDEVTVIIGEFGANLDLCAECQNSNLFPLLKMMSVSDGLEEMTVWDFARLGHMRPNPHAFLPPAEPGAEAATISNRPGKKAVAKARKRVAAIDSTQKSRGKEIVPEFFCQCGAGFTAEKGLEMHRRKYGGKPHSLPRKFGGPSTAKLSATTVVAPKHTAASKPGRAREALSATDGPYVCQGCGQTFTRPWSLKTHEDKFGTQPHPRPTRRGAAAIADSGDEPPHIGDETSPHNTPGELVDVQTESPSPAGDLTLLFTPQAAMAG